MRNINALQEWAIQLLQELIKTPSFSGQEEKTRNIIIKYLNIYNIEHQCIGNNILMHNVHYSDDKPTLLLNSHHDTIKVVKNWTYDPHGAFIENDTLYGLGANDAGASLVSLLATFVYFYHQPLACNLMLAASAEEENFGPNGIRQLVRGGWLKHVDCAIVGEPTEMHMAVSERGLLVVDGVARGHAGHAARDEGENAIYIAMKDIQALREVYFDKLSKYLGTVKVSVTQIEAGYQHNVIPDECSFVLDVRVNDKYSLEDVFQKLQGVCVSKLTARSFNNKSSGINMNHPIVRTAKKLKINTFGSKTISDQAHLPFPSVKMGPGDSLRSHTPNEFIHLYEIREGIERYIAFIAELSSYYSE